MKLVDHFVSHTYVEMRSNLTMVNILTKFYHGGNSLEKS
jgi:hypothetical protein